MNRFMSVSDFEEVWTPLKDSLVEQRKKYLTLHKHTQSLVQAALQQKTELEVVKADNEKMKEDLLRLKDEVQVKTERILHLKEEVEMQKEQIQLLEKDKNDGPLCVMCMNAKVDVLFRPCGHVCMCKTCMGKLRYARNMLNEMTKFCPVCRLSIVSYQTVYVV